MDVPSDSSMRSSAESVTGPEALEVTLVRSSGSDGFSEHQAIVQVSSSHTASPVPVANRDPTSPQQRPASTPVSASPAAGAATPPRFNINSINSISSAKSPSAAKHNSASPADMARFGAPALDFHTVGAQQQQQQPRHSHQIQANQGGGMRLIPELRTQDDFSHPQGGNPAGPEYFDTDDDERTEPSSTVTGNTGENGNGYTRTDNDPTSTFGRTIHNTRRRLSSGNGNGYERSGSMDDADYYDGALIYGYLQKLGRNGKWQTRWFETDGECLTYYKSNKRVKLLATLDLAKVGSIVVNHDDPKGTSFTINISERPYELRADSKSACKDWVITLNRVKEARMQEGNVKLVNQQQPQHRQRRTMVDLLDQSNSSSGYAPRVVVVANRLRTRKVGEGLDTWENSAGWDQNPADSGVEVDYGGTPSFVGKSSNHLARWRKSSGSFNKVADKVLRWARSLRKYGCTDVDNNVVVFDYRHNYPAMPPDDGKVKSVPMHHVDYQNDIGGHSAWIGKEKAASSSVRSIDSHSVGPGLAQQAVAPTTEQDVDDGTHELS